MLLLAILRLHDIVEKGVEDIRGKNLYDEGTITLASSLVYNRYSQCKLEPKSIRSSAIKSTQSLSMRSCLIGSSGQ